MVSATATMVLVAAGLLYLRGMPGRAPGITLWAAAFAALAGAFALAALPSSIDPRASIAGVGLLRLLAGALLYCGCRLFTRRSAHAPAMVLLVGLAALGVLLAVSNDIDAVWIAGPTQTLAGAILAWTGIGLLRLRRAGDRRSGHAVAGAALVLLGAYTGVIGWALPPGGVNAAAVVAMEFGSLAVAGGLAFVAQDAVRQRVRLAERRLQDAVEALDQGFALYDAEDRLVMANAAYRRLFPRIGRSIEAGTTYRELLQVSAEAGQYVEAAGREDEWIAERMAHHRLGGQGLEQQLADGRWVYLLERRTPGGEWASLRVDITDIKQRERELAESERRYRDLVEGSIQGIIIHDNWRLLFANRAAAAMLGFADVPQLLAVGTLQPLLADHEVERLAGYRDARATGRVVPAHYEADMLCRDGTPVTMDCMIRRIHWRGQTVTQATLMDVTERKRVVRELREHQEHLEELVQSRTAELQATNEELEAFAYAVSHDLRAPLRRVRGFADALAEDWGRELEPEASEYLGRLQGAAAQMEQLIDDMLNLSRLFQADLQCEEVDLSALAHEILDDLRAEAPQRSVRCDIEPGLVVTGDARLLRIALENLLQNAWKYTVREREARISMRSVVLDGVLHYEIRDNGVGFDMRYAERLFSPFQRLHTRDEFDGVGVGLATVARIVRRHGGAVTAEGVVGGGAVFRFTLGTVAAHAVGVAQ